MDCLRRFLVKGCIIACLFFGGCAAHHTSTVDMGHIDPQGQKIVIEDDAQTKKNYKESADKLQKVNTGLTVLMVVGVLLIL